MAKKYWPKEDPIGQVMVIGKGLGPEFDDPPRQIVGIVGNVREAGLKNGEVPVMYVPQSQVPEGLTELAASVAAALLGNPHECGSGQCADGD